MPPHLQQMFLDNISEPNDDQKSKFRDLITEVLDVFSKDDLDLGCLNLGVEHKIQTYDEIPINEKFRRTPLQFQKQGQEYIEKINYRSKALLNPLCLNGLRLQCLSERRLASSGIALIIVH